MHLLNPQLVTFVADVLGITERKSAAIDAQFLVIEVECNRFELVEDWNADNDVVEARVETTVDEVKRSEPYVCSKSEFCIGTSNDCKALIIEANGRRDLRRIDRSDVEEIGEGDGTQAETSTSVSEGRCLHVIDFDQRDRDLFAIGGDCVDLDHLLIIDKLEFSSCSRGEGCHDETGEVVLLESDSDEVRYNPSKKKR